MSDTEAGPIGGPGRPSTAGQQLRAAREAKGWTLQEVASRTRIPVRHLEAIETGQFAELPSSTYAIGFAKAYARQVGIDEVAVGHEVRRHADETGRASAYVPYEMDDPTRVPSRSLAWVAGLIALALMIGMAVWFAASRLGARHATGTGTTAAAAPPSANASPAPPAHTATGVVVLTATDAVWLRVYDAANKTLFERTMQPGDRFQVPATATDPQINVGRPDQLNITIDGAPIPPLGDGSRAIKDVGVSAAALRARIQGQPPAAASPSPDAARRSSDGKPTGVPPAFASPGAPSPAQTADQPGGTTP